MACAGCGAKYRRINNLGRRRVSVPVSSKYDPQRKPSKQVANPVAPRKIDPQIAIGLLSSIANSIPK